jgi:imidazolonepropionase-like amidohydrolase
VTARAPLRRAAPAGVLALLLAAAGAAPQDAPREGAKDPPKILLRGATILTMAGDPIPDGGVLFVPPDSREESRGRITSVGRNLPAPENTVVVDCAGRFVVPGFLDAGTQVGLVDIDLVKAANDSDGGVAPSTPELDVRDGINIESPVFGVTRSHGVTTVLVRPQSTNVINGTGAVLHCTEGTTIAERTVLAPAALHVSLGASAKARFAEKDEMPSTRMGVAALLRREFERAADYREKWRRWEERRKTEPEAERPESDPGLAVLAKALAREIPVFAGADRLDDIRTALRIGEEFGLRLAIVGGAEAWKCAKDIAERKVPVIYGPVVTQPDSPERPGARMDAARLLRDAGVPFCLMTGDAHNARNLPYHAGIAASWGLPESEALAAITREAARILGVDRDLGTIEAGKEATLCVFSGSPLEPLSRLERMYVRGREVPLRNRQTDLFEKWKER